MNTLLPTDNDWCDYYNAVTSNPQPQHDLKDDDDDEPECLYEDILRRFVRFGFLLATPEIAAYYLECYGNCLEPSPFGNKIEEVDLCTMTEIYPGIFVYATHDRSEDVFRAIRNCRKYFKTSPHNKIWLMPPLDDEEMVSNIFVFVVDYNVNDDPIATIKEAFQSGI